MMRAAATATLDRTGIPWRIAYSSTSLAEIWAAVAAGLGVTVRARAGISNHLCVLSGLPELPRIGPRLHRADAGPQQVIQRLSDMLRTRLGELTPAG